LRDEKISGLPVVERKSSRENRQNLPDKNGGNTGKKKSEMKQNFQNTN
jgi:hypothetical protein